jgi:hypothetical protein
MAGDMAAASAGDHDANISALDKSAEIDCSGIDLSTPMAFTMSGI